MGRLIFDLVILPVTAWDTPPAFAFGDEWTRLLPFVCGFARTAGWGRGRLTAWPGADGTRSVDLWEQLTVGARVLVVQESGPPRPFDAAEVRAIRDLVLARAR